MDDDKAYLLRGKGLRFLIRMAQEWDTLRVVLGPEGSPISLSKAANGSILSIPITAGQGGDGGSGLRRPLDLYIDGIVVKMVYGTINGNVPASVQGGSDPVSYDLVANKFWSNITVDEFGAYVSSVVEFGDTVPDNTDTNRYRLLGEIKEVDGFLKPFNAIRSSLEYQRCGVNDLYGGFGE